MFKAFDLGKQLTDGHKTYICAALLGLVTAAHALGWINDEVCQALSGMCVAGGLAALRAGVKKASF